MSEIRIRYVKAAAPYSDGETRTVSLDEARKLFHLGIAVPCGEPEHRTATVDEHKTARKATKR